jgi:pregnancy-associated plasma protein-A
MEGAQQQLCGTMDHHWHMARESAEYRSLRADFERRGREWVTRYGGGPLPTEVIRVPVVFHVVYRTDEEKVPEGNFQSLLDRVNLDFRGENADRADILPQFAPFASATRIEFQLAARDPECKATTGITYTKTDTVTWVPPDWPMKSAAHGGHDSWDTRRYLNVWVGNLSGLAGFSSFPGELPADDGIMLDYRHAGVDAAYLNSHLLTHEIGHWFGLLHIWGYEDDDNCETDDEVVDTPRQLAPSEVAQPCPREPPGESCPGNGGDMFQNFMDYSSCTNFFTKGQAMRMLATLHTARQGLIASEGLYPPPHSPGPDLWMQNVPEDSGAEPDPSPQPMFISRDIWIRRANDGNLNSDHENAVHRPGRPNFVYVRVRNRGCDGSQSGTLKLYWAKGSGGLAWPAPWDGSVTSPALMGKPIGQQPVSLAVGESKVFEFPWEPPDPNDYASFGADQTHFCLLARIETQGEPPYGMTVAETWDIEGNVRENNNIVWRNVTVMGDGGDNQAKMIVANFAEDERRESLVFHAVPQGDRSILDWGRVLVRLPDELAAKIDEEDLRGIERVDDAEFEIFEPGAAIGRFQMTPLEDLHAIELSFVPYEDAQLLGARVFELDVMQVAEDYTAGGVRFAFKTTTPPVEADPPAKRFDGVSWVAPV